LSKKKGENAIILIREGRKEGFSLARRGRLFFPRRRGKGGKKKEDPIYPPRGKKKGKVLPNRRELTQGSTKEGRKKRFAQDLFLDYKLTAGRPSERSCRAAT